MQPGIRITRVWSDDDMLEVAIEVADRMSRFVNRVYVGYRDLADTIDKLEEFKAHVHGGLIDVRFGEFGPEYGGGAFHARLHFLEPGRLFITCRQESNFSPFGKKTVASCATIYLCSEPALLDRFIDELRRIPADPEGAAYLEGI
jgi:hypothetical protein